MFGMILFFMIVIAVVRGLFRMLFWGGGYYGGLYRPFGFYHRPYRMMGPGPMGMHPMHGPMGGPRMRGPHGGMGPHR